MQDERFRIDIQTEAGLAFIDRNANRPFFLYLAYYAPHVPLEASEKYLSRFPGDMPERRRTGLAMMNAVDEGVGRLVKRLKEQGIYENTLIMFTSDNGAPLGAQTGKPMNDVLPVGKAGPAWDGSRNDPLTGEKGMLAEGGIRVPGILRFPGRIQPGSESDEPVCGLDVLPTLAALAGIERKPDRAIDGTSFVEVFTGKPIRRVTPLYWHYYNALGAPKAAMRAGDWMVLGSWGQTDQRGGGFFRESDQKLVKTMELKHFELYNLKRDRDQKKNLAETEPARLKELSVQLVKKYREVQAEGPEWKFGK